MLNPFNPSKQKQVYRLLNRLLQGTVTSAEIIKEMDIFNYTGRLSDIRKKGFQVKAQRIEGSLFEYRLLSPSGRA